MLHIVLKPGKEEFVKRFHPWIFSGAIAKIDGKASDGALAEVVSHRGEVLAIGHYHAGSIAVKLLVFCFTSNQKFDPNQLTTVDFWVEKLNRAWHTRAQLGLTTSPTTNCFRLVHGEGDGMPGLIVDLYGPTAVMQCHSVGMHLQRHLIAEALTAFTSNGIHSVYDKSSETLPANYAASQTNGWLIAPPAASDKQEGIFMENGVQFEINWETGQKTGFFLDQRDNRALLARYCQGKSVLNTFCYTGGFSCYALKNGATEVHSVDVSAKAMALTDRNIALNGPFEGTHVSHCTDVQPFLQQHDQLFDIVIVDPPAFAKSIEKRHNAVQGYKRLNASAINRLKPGGLLFTFSCSQVIDRELFYNTIVAAALESGRQGKVLHHMTQGGDHPVSIYHTEGSYLKGLVLEF